MFKISNFLSRFNVSKFIKVFNTNKLDSSLCSSIISTYNTTLNNPLYIYTSASSFKYTFGSTIDDFVKDILWDSFYIKIIQDYADTYNECISPQQQVSAYHKLWDLKSNIVNAWISSYNNNIFNILTSLTLLHTDSKYGYVVIEFKHFQSVKLKVGETVTFPSNFEYSYRVDLKGNNVKVLFSQVTLKPY